MITTVIFDLDGTLLDTLSDLAGSVNHALSVHGFPARTRQEVRAFLGNGIRQLMLQAVPYELEADRFESVLATFRAHYVDHCLDLTAPYEGIDALLKALKARGIRLAIVSNKLDPAVQELRDHFFAASIPLAIGESPAIRRKPNPDSLFEAMRRLGSKPEETLYVGDSEVDLETACRAGVRCVTVLWGFRDEDFLRGAGATCCVSEPSGILEIVDAEAAGVNASPA